MGSHRLIGFLVLFVTAALLSACSANHKAIFHHQAVEQGAWITTTDAKQRAILSSIGRGGANRFCAEPSPDVFAVIAQSLSVGGTFGQQADPKAIQAALNAAFSSSEQGSTIPRTQTINMLRELMYRTCERYLNGSITSLELPLQAIRDQRLIVSILAIEQLTGAVATKAVALGAMAQATAGTSAAGGMAVLEKARTEWKTKATALAVAQAGYKLKVKVKKDDKEEDVEACVATDNAKTEADRQALPQAVKDKATECGKLKTALEKAETDHKEAKAYYDQQIKLADAGGIPVASGTSLMTPTAVGALDKAVGGNLGEVSSVVQEIVKMNFDQDEFKFLCLKVLSGELSNEQEKMAKKLWSKCIEYASEKIEADLRLTGLRVDAEMTRLQTSSNDQFESFWKTISAPDGSAIDSERLEAVRQKSAKVLRWPDCFKEARTKEETRQCFMRLVSFRRNDLLQAATQP